MALGDLTSFVWKHPLNVQGRVAALGRVVRRQWVSRVIPGSVALPFVGDMHLFATRGMSGAAGNWSCGLREHAEMGFPSHVLREADLFVDVGANIGSHTVLASGAGVTRPVRRAAAVISVTESFREDLVARGIDREKIHVVINGVDLDRYEPQPRDAGLEREFALEGKFVAGYMGTHGLAHALPKVLEAAERLREREDIVFFFAGSGAQRGTVERVVAERGLANVRLIPRQPKARMPALWSACDVAIVPLRDNPVFATVIPSKIFESMGMGVPILMSLPEGEATRIVRETGAGVCVPPEDPAAMAAAIVELAEHPDRVAALRAAARAAAPQFSRDRLAMRMADILARIGR